MRLGAGVVLVLVLGACGDNVVRAPATLTVGGLEVRLDEVPARIEVRRGDEVLWATAPGLARDGDEPAVFAATRRTDAAVSMQFGSFRFEPDDDTPWRGVATLAVTAQTAATITFELRDRVGDPMGTGEVTLTAADGAGEVVLGLDLSAVGGNRASIAFACEDRDHFLGLGGQSFAVDHRGQSVALWVQEDGISKLDVPDDNYDGVWALTGRRHSTHTPMPMMLSSRGWALALDTNRRARFDLCATDPALARLEAWDDQLTVRLFVGNSPRDSIARMTAWIGRPAVPPAFAFAPWLDAIYGQANVRRVADALRAADVPVSVIWSEDWRGGNDETGPAGGYVLEEDWRVDRTIYPDFEGLAGHLHDSGYKFLTYANTFIDTDADVRSEAIALGHTIKRPDGSVHDFLGVKFRDSTLLDLSSPAAVAWAKGVYGETFAIGSDGWMADFGEWLPTDAVLASGESGLDYHNQYATDWLRLNHELFTEAQARDGIERLYFARAGGLGAQPYMQVVWAGDQQTDFTVGDGLPSVIPMGIGLGLTGFPYFGHDIAGYMSQTTVPVSRELWFRWVTFGALSPVMRTHHGRSARENWHWERDAETTAHLRRWAKLHMQLVPYLRMLAVDAHATGAPLFRPFVIDHPTWTPGWSLADQYMLGDRIAVAPVVVAGATSREVRLPAGRWYGLLDGAALDSDGDRPLSVSATVSEIPAFVPDCSVLAMYPERVDTVVATAGVAGAGVVTAAAVGDDRELWLYPCQAPGAGGVRTMTEAGGLTYVRSGGFGPGAAAWNGAPVTFAAEGSGGRWLSAEVVGPGRLTVDGVEVVRADGGAAGRRIRLRSVGP